MKSTKILYITATLLIIFGIPLHGMNKLAWYENTRIYSKGTAVIDVMATIKSNLQFTFFKLCQGKKNNPTFQQQYIQNKLNQIEKKIRQDEEDSIQALFDDYKISNEARMDTASIINTYKQATFYYMSQPRENVVHHAQFPQEILPIFKKNGIHPQAVNLIISKDSDSDPKSVAGSIGMKGDFESNEKGITIYNMQAPSIILFPRYFHRNACGRVSTLLHETQHLIENHSQTTWWINYIISQQTSVEENKITKNKYFHNLETIHERQAEILPSLKDALAAKILRQQATTSFYPHRLFLGHYAQLTEIDELHKLKTRLSHHQPKRMQKIDDLRVMKTAMDQKFM